MGWKIYVWGTQSPRCRPAFDDAVEAITVSSQCCCRVSPSHPCTSCSYSPEGLFCVIRLIINLLLSSTPSPWSSSRAMHHQAEQLLASNFAKFQFSANCWTVNILEGWLKCNVFWWIWCALMGQWLAWQRNTLIVVLYDTWDTTMGVLGL